MADVQTFVKDLVRLPLEAACGPVFLDKLQFYRFQGYWPDYKNPKTFNEKTCARKFYYPLQDAKILCDKWDVRAFVKSRVGEEVLNKVYYVGDHPESVPWNDLPKRFFAKGTHGSGDNYIIRVEDKDQLSFENFCRQARKILKLRHGRFTYEPWYGEIKPQIIVEKFLGDAQYLVTPDYKFFVFNGRVRAICVITGRYDDEGKASFYDENWNRYPFSIKRKPGPDLPPPPNLAELMGVASRLAAGYDFMRVDLYNVNGKQIVFGEMTVCYGAGRERFRPDRTYDEIFGSYWQLPASA